MTRPRRKRSTRRSGAPGQGQGPGRDQNPRRRQPRAKKSSQRSGRRPSRPSIARTFWGTAWCRNLEASRDARDQLARGRTYMRHDAVQAVDISPGKIQAAVQGMEVFFVTIEIDPVDAQKWQTLRRKCMGRNQSLRDLLAGRLPTGVLARLSDRRQGLFPKPEEMGFDCTCDSSAEICEHTAAVLYAVALHLDRDPKLFFVLRGIKLEEFSQGLQRSIALDSSLPWHPDLLTDPDLEGIFGIELSDFANHEEDGFSGSDEPESEEADESARRPLKRVQKQPQPTSRGSQGRSSSRAPRSRGPRGPNRSGRRPRRRR